ncbi:MAG: CRISPR-associated protein Csx18 [Coleofasciculaceae cyanobacterium]
MYISTRSQQLRNALVSISTGSITLIILLIAPLGLAAVIINSLLVTLATYLVSSVADRVIVWLLPPTSAELFSHIDSLQQSLRRRNAAMERKR